MGVKMGVYKDGVIRDESGETLGNINRGVIRDGSSMGSGNVLGNVHKGVIRDGSSISGNVLFNVKGGAVRDGTSLGSGIAIGKLADFTIKGMVGEPAADIVATYHFLVKKIV